MKLCKDCRWHDPAELYPWTCHAPNAKRRIDFVYGGVLPTHCANQRADADGCGPEGKLYEAREAAPVGAEV